MSSAGGRTLIRGFGGIFGMNSDHSRAAERPGDPRGTPDAREAGSPTASKRGPTRFPRRTYPFRVLGMGLAGLAVAFALHEIGAPRLTWAFLFCSAVLWPHLAYWIAVRSPDPYHAEIRNLLIDSVIAGAWMPMIHFNLLPSTLIVTVTTVDRISTGIRNLWSRSMSALGLGGLASALVTGLHFEPTTSMQVLVACLPLLLIHTIAVSLGSNRLIRRVWAQNLELDRLRRIDTLTGLSRRGDWEERAEELLETRNPHGRRACLLLIDIDDFKQVNDHYGHAAGDAVLRAVAVKLASELRSRDEAGRLGGDEFVVLLLDATAEGGHAIAGRLCAAVEGLRLREYPEVRATISVGLAEIGAAPGSLREWLAEADRALYRAKAAGRNRVV